MCTSCFVNVWLELFCVTQAVIRKAKEPCKYFNISKEVYKLKKPQVEENKLTTHKYCGLFLLKCQNIISFLLLGYMWTCCFTCNTMTRHFFHCFFFFPPETKESKLHT